MTTRRTLIGVDIGGTKVAAALVRGRLPEPGARTPAEVETPEIVDRFTVLTDVSSAEACLRAVEDCIARSRARLGRVEGIGVGVASMVDFAGGRIVESVNLPLSDVPLRDHLRAAVRRPRRRRQRRHGRRHRRARLRRRRRHARHAHAHARAPVWAAASSAAAARYRGASGAAAEIGHIIIDVNGPKCPANCPNHGCLEAYVAGPAMGAAARVAAELEPDSALGRALAAGRTRRQPPAHPAGDGGRRRRDRRAGARRRVPRRRARHARPTSSIPR